MWINPNLIKYKPEIANVNFYIIKGRQKYILNREYEIEQE